MGFKNNLKSVYTTLVLGHFSTSLCAPLFAFLFFEKSSPLLPYATSMPERAIYFGIFLTLYKIASMLSNPFFGTLSDIIGRKKVYYIIILGMLIYGLAGIISNVFNNIWIFMIGTTIFGFLWAMNSISVATINDVTIPSKKAIKLAFMQTFIGIGILAGPVFGGRLGSIKILGHDYILPFIILSLFAIVLFFFVKFTYNDTFFPKQIKKDKKKFPLKSCLVELFSSKAVLWLVLVYILDQISWGTYYDFAPSIAKTVFHLNVKEIGWFDGIIGASLIVSSGLLLPFLKKFSKDHTLMLVASTAGLIGVSAAYMSSFFPEYNISYLILWISIFPVVACDIIIFCTLISYFSNVISSEYQGTLIGLIYIIGMIAGAIMAPINGILMSYKMNLPLVVCPIAMILLIIIVLILRKRRGFDVINVQLTLEAKKESSNLNIFE